MKLVNSNLVTVMLAFPSLLIYLSTYHPSLFSLCETQEMVAGWPVQGVSYWNGAIASSLNQCAQELGGKNVGRGETSETGHSFLAV